MRNTAFWEPWPAGLLLAAATFVPMAAHAQAWLPEAGRGSIYIGYQYGQAHWTLLAADITGVPFGPYFGEGKRVAKGEHYGQFFAVDLYYGIRKGLGLSVRVPYAVSKYVGLYPPPNAPHLSEDPHLHFGTHGIDDGKYHGTFGDGNVGLHQTVLSEPFVATPFVKYLYPLQHYEAEGHSAAGKRLRALEVGAALARTLRPFLPDAYAQVTYSYTAMQRVIDHTFHQNRVQMELGYFVTPKLSLKAAADWSRMNGGVEWDFGKEHIRYRFNHDRLGNERWWRTGGGVNYVLTPRYVVYIYGFGTVAGANTHAVHTFATGVGWNFTTPWAREAPGRNPENR